MPYRELRRDEINKMFAESRTIAEKKWSADLGGDVYKCGVRAAGYENPNPGGGQTFTGTEYWLDGRRDESVSKRDELMQQFDAAGTEHGRRQWTEEEDQNLRDYKNTVPVGWTDCKETDHGFELGTGVLLLGRTKSAVEKHWRHIKDQVPSLDADAADDSEGTEESAPTSPGSRPGLLVFLGDSNCRSLATGDHRNKAHMDVWSNKFGVAGKIPAVNGGVNRSVYGFDSGSVNVRTYLGDAKKAVPKKCGDDFRDALAALKNEPRGLVFWGFKNHIEGSQGSDRFRDSIVDYCNFLIDDVRQYSEFTAKTSFPIYLVGLFQPQQEPAVNAVNEAIKTVAQRKDGNVHYIDLADHLDAEHASKEDKLHLSSEGYVEAVKAIALAIRTVEQKLPRAGAGASAEAGPSAGGTPPPSQKDLEDCRTQGQEADESIRSIQREKRELNAPSEEDVANLKKEMESLKSQLREKTAAHKTATEKRSQWEVLDREEQAHVSKRSKITERQQKLEKAANARETYMAAMAEANAAMHDN